MNKLLKWALYALGGVVGLVVVLLIIVYAVSQSRINHRYAITPPALAIPTDSTAIARGRHLATAIAKCVDCHGEDLSGKVVVDDPAFARVVAPNLTRSSTGWGTRLKDADWVRAIRHGVGPDGRGLVIMPSDDYVFLGDADLAALIAYAKSVPPMERQLPATRFGPISRVLLATGKMPAFAAAFMDHTTPLKASPPAGVTVEYGRYQADIGGCTGCHGPGLSGGPIPSGPPDWPPARNLTPEGIGSWTEADFVRALREGKRPDGLELNPAMPVRLTRLMTDDEIKAVWAFLKTVPPKPYGGR